MYKLIILDLDGTLLHTDKSISPYTLHIPGYPDRHRYCPWGDEREEFYFKSKSRHHYFQRRSFDQLQREVRLRGGLFS